MTKTRTCVSGGNSFWNARLLFLADSDPGLDLPAASRRAEPPRGVPGEGVRLATASSAATDETLGDPRFTKNIPVERPA